MSKIQKKCKIAQNQPGCPNSFPMKLRYPSPPIPIVINLIILCRAIPRSTTGVDGPSKAMKSYISCTEKKKIEYKKVTHVKISTMASLLSTIFPLMILIGISDEGGIIQGI